MQPYESQSGGRDWPTSPGEFTDLASVTLLPVSVVVFGSETQPLERLLWLQSAVAKAVHMAAVIARLRFGRKLAHLALAALAPQKTGEGAARGFDVSRIVPRIATRYDNLADNYLAFIQPASIRPWSRLNKSTP